MSEGIDKRAVLALVSEVGDSAARRLYGVFRAECGSFSSALSDAFLAGNIEQVCVISHSLKGSARQFGATRLAEYCRTLEMMSESNADESAAGNTTYTPDLQRASLSDALADVLDEAARIRDHIDATLLPHSPAS